MKKDDRNMLKCYYMDISDGYAEGKLRDLYKILPEDRQKKSDGLDNKGAREKYILSSAFLQYGLSRTLGVPVEDISYQYGAYGKPFLAGRVAQEFPDVDFNLSHSGKYAVLAVSDRPVGIDIEKRRKDRSHMAKRFFCEEEYMDIIEPLSKEEQDKRFLEYWTMKEAYSKRLGEGLRIPLNSFRIIRRKEGLSFVERGEVYFAVLYGEREDYCVSICSNMTEELELLERKCHRFENGALLLGRGDRIE